MEYNDVRMQTRSKEVNRRNKRLQDGKKTETRCEETSTKEVAVKQDTHSNMFMTIKTYRHKDIIDEAVEDRCEELGLEASSQP
jgi:hypothetical protein